MIPDDVLTLLTAAVDGELTPAEATTVRALLEFSQANRALYKQLRADRQRLRKLPHHTPPADLHTRVMSRLPTRTPVELPRPTPRPRRGSAVPLGIAASVLLVVGGGSFSFFVNQPQPTRGANPAVAARAEAARERQWAKLLPRESEPAQSAPAAIEQPPEVARAVVAVADPIVPEIAPEPRPVVRDVLTFPPLPDVGKFDLARVRVPFLATVAEFSRDEVQQQLTTELGQDPAFRIDLFARDPGRGVELFQAAAKGSALTVFADTKTTEKVQKKQAVAYLVYTDSLTPPDLRDLFARLAAADAKAPQRTFDAVHATPATPTDQRDLRDTLGIDPGIWKRPAPTAGEPKSVASGTAAQITRTFTDPTGKGGEKVAMLMTFAPVTARTRPTESREISQFLARRGDRRPTAVPVLIVIRQANG